MNGSVLIQSFKQIWGILVLSFKNNGKLPDIESYHSQTRYSLPFNGEWVVANGGVTQKTSHSWEIPTQRYAYDFVILDETGKSSVNEGTDAHLFYCYGKDILAPADGVVAEVYSEGQNSVITKNRAASCNARDIRGNYILIGHTNNEYSLLAHLKPNSVLVSVGQAVKRGEKIAECGNTGNTSEPHLHFQVQLGMSFYSSPGVPIEFENIQVKETPNYETFDDRRLDEDGESVYPPYIKIGQTVGNA